jgi:hypothetical protein
MGVTFVANMCAQTAKKCSTNVMITAVCVTTVQSNALCVECRRAVQIVPS